MNLIIEHRVDFDGIIGGLILEKYLGSDYKVLGWNYGDPIPDVSEYSKVWMIDICLPPDFMINNKTKIVWIDHHITQINEATEKGYSDIPGIRETGKAACILGWEYLFGSNVPKFIQIIGAYDIWDHTTFDWNTTTLPLQYALKTEYNVSNRAIKPVFEDLLTEKGLEDLIEKGRLILKYLGKTWKSWCKNYAFEVEVAGKHKGICMMTPQFGSTIFESLGGQEEYQIKICVNKSKGKFHASLYTDTDLGDFGLGDYVKSICQTGVAGGHKNACGIELTEEQFLRLILDCEI